MPRDAPERILALPHLVQLRIERGIVRGIERGLAPLLGQIARKLRRSLTDDDRRAIATRLDLAGPERLGDAVLDVRGDALAAWLADPDAR